MGSRSSDSKVAKEHHKEFKILERIFLCSFEFFDSLGVVAADEKEQQEIGVYKNTFGAIVGNESL